MQKSVLIAFAVVGTLTAGYLLLKQQPAKPADATSDMKSIYNSWKSKHKVKVGASEDDYRFKVFSSNYDHINKHNKNSNKTYKLGLNDFSHLTQEEFDATYLGLESTEKVATNFTALKTDNLKVTVDWKAKMNPVKNQGHCGSCWAFSAVAAIEGAHHVTRGNLYNLSEQELVDCSRPFGNNGCNGGLKDQAFSYVVSVGGLATEHDYPYTAVDGVCKTSGFQRYGKISGHTIVPPKNSSTLMAALNQQPVAVSVEATIWKSYSSGIMNDPACGTALNHAVIAVGYSTEDSSPYFVIRNSWGEGWGEAGHIRIAMQDGEGVCGVQKTPYFPNAL